MLPKKSKMMDMLYGEDASQAVYDRCQALSSGFNELVQNVVYDVFWARPGLTLKEKSLVTIVTLITLNKEEQLKIHLGGLFNLGGTPEDVSQLLNYMLAKRYINSTDKASKILTEVIFEKGLNQKYFAGNHLEKPVNLSARELSLVDLVAHVAIADAGKTKGCLNLLLENKALSENDIENILLHEMVYSGFPCAMNGFAILKSILKEE